ncbi:hypothetical protein Rs2_41920 [Raphanus sativus]|nr:hypothetical protein Rs2_41920 [Raphanus sativus]
MSQAYLDHLWEALRHHSPREIKSNAIFVSSKVRVSIQKVRFRTPIPNSLPSSSWVTSKDSNFWFGVSQRKNLVRASLKCSDEKSPYDTLTHGKFKSFLYLTVSFRWSAPVDLKILCYELSVNE